MFLLCVQTGISHPHLRYTVSWLIAAILTLQSLSAADAWPRVTRLNVGEDLAYDTLISGEREAGRFLGADIAGITIQTIEQGDITIARDLVLQVAIEQNRKKNRNDAGSRSHWPQLQPRLGLLSATKQQDISSARISRKANEKLVNRWAH
jgi:hypothetical protein